MPCQPRAPLWQAAVLASLLCGGAAGAQSDTQDDLIVRGQRGSAITDIKPLMQLDGRAIADTGAATMQELLKAIAPMTGSAGAGEPILLLNGRRVAGYQEIGTLPLEAIVNVEVLPAQAALKFGYPATRTVVNFIIKPRFEQLSTILYGSGATDGGTGTEDLFANVTHIANDRRLSLTGEYRHVDRLLQSQRQIRPDQDNPFDAIGNVTAADNGEIDPTLSAAAGHPVFIAAVPADPGQRGQLSAYLAGADRPRSFDIGPYRTLQAGTDQVTLNGVFAAPLSKNVSGTFSFSADRKAETSLQGLPAESILVPTGNGFSPFAKDVLLHRYLTESRPLALHSVTTLLNLAAVVRGRLGKWDWDLTGSFDQNDVSNHGPDILNRGAIDQAVTEGANPFAPISPALLANRQRQQSRSINRTEKAKAVASGSVVHLPAGDVTLTVTAEAEHATAHSRVRSVENAALSIGRTRAEAGMALDVPLVSPDTHLPPFLGRISLNLSGNVRQVQGYGTLSDTSYGLTWSPSGRFQLIGSVKQTGIAPDMRLRNAPVVQTANVPFFDAITGQSVLVTTIAGGNPSLAAEQRTERSLNLAWQPFATDKLYLRMEYSVVTARNQALQVTALNPATQAAFPDLFERDASGRLTIVRFQPINFYREHQHLLVVSGNFRTPLGKAPPKSVDPKRPPPQRPALLFGGMVTPLLQDRLRLRPGSPELNLASGDTYDASATRRRFGVDTWTGLNYKSMGIDIDERWISGIRLRGGTPENDLHFAPLLKFDVVLHAKLDGWFPHHAWARKSSLYLTIFNALNRRQRVWDGTGATPDRYQPDYLDPVGRQVKLAVRKLF